MRLEQLTYLLEIARCGTVTEAARRCSVSQPNITTALKGLETELGTVLFERSKNGMTLTRSGEDACKLAAEILERTEQLRQLESRLHGSAPISVRIATIPSLNNAILGQWLDVYRLYYPAASVYNIEGSSAAVIRKVLDGNADIGFVSLRGASEPSHVLSYQRVCNTYPYICLGKTLAQGFSSPINIRELKGIPFFSQNPDYVCHNELLIRLKQENDSVIFYSSSQSAIKAMVKANQGAAVFSSVALAGDDDVASGKIVPLRARDYFTPSTLYVVHRSEHPLPTEIREFIRIAKTKLNELLTDYFPDD